jgi:membrane protein implicated in regulation of membrane protease activity
MIAFLVIGGIGFALLVITWVAGELFDFGQDVAGWFGGGGGDAGGFEGDLDGGPSVFSSRVIFTFLTAFGGGGAIATIYGLSAVPASAIGVVSGVLLGGLTWAVARGLWRQQATSTLEMSSLVGRRARVAVAIPAGGPGQITVNVGSGSSTFLALSRDGGAIAHTAEVEIVALEGDTLIVRAVSSDSRASGA